MLKIDIEAVISWKDNISREWATNNMYGLLLRLAHTSTCLN